MSRFRHLVLELGHGAADPETMRQAAAFALLVDAELHALFVEDEALLLASALPFAREISPLSYQWRRLEPDRLQTDLRAAADRARRLLAEIARTAGVKQNFEVRRGDLAVQLSGLCIASDIVVVAPQRRIGSGPTHGFRRLRETARRSAASVLFLPPSAPPPRGVIVAVTVQAGDPSLAVARTIANRERERLVVVAADTDDSAGEPVLRLSLGEPPGDSNVAAALGDTRERLIVMTRPAPTEPGDNGDVGAGLAEMRGVPVLVVEPG